MTKRLLNVVLVGLLVAPLGASPGQAQTPGELDRSVSPVVLTGAQFPSWSAGADPTLREPQAPGNPGALGGGIPADPLGQSDCDAEPPQEDGSVDHSCYQASRLPRNPFSGAPVERILGYRWDGDGFEQIPFQVDERFARYISNNASDFGAYSGVDHHNTYAFDREGWRFTWDQLHATGAGDPCLAVPRPGGETATADPVAGLDNDDEMAFMFADAGEPAPDGAALPGGIVSSYKVNVTDPRDPQSTKTIYVMLASAGGPAPAFTAANSPYVRYQRDANADTFVFSESSYEDYGAAPKGPYCNEDGSLAAGVDPNNSATWKQRRPLDRATITTPRYSFRYEGRWLMTELRISANNDWIYGPDVIDRWKARAFAQDPSSETPCCGYEEEDTNWGGSSILMGERAGAVRVIRETWGADSSTNNARREVFYAHTIEFGDALRVHPIPPLDGIYVQWDHTAGVMTRYYNPSLPAEGIPIDGSNMHEAFGNLDDPCNARYDAQYHSEIDTAYRSTYKSAGLCDLSPYHQSVDVVDLTSANPSGSLQWEQVGGPGGTLVTRWALRDVTPGGAAQGILATPYYRDDSCFDDGTGTNPGNKLHLRSGDEPLTWGYDAGGVPRSPAPDPAQAIPRTCWEPGDPIDPAFSPQGDIRYFQGSIGTHGLHLLLIAESDNAYLTVPLTEIDSVQYMTVLPPCEASTEAGCNVGERFGRDHEIRLITSAQPMDQYVAVSL